MRENKTALETTIDTAFRAYRNFAEDNPDKLRASLNAIGVDANSHDVHSIGLAPDQFSFLLDTTPLGAGSLFDAGLVRQSKNVENPLFFDVFRNRIIGRVVHPWTEIRLLYGVLAQGRLLGRGSGSGFASRLRPGDSPWQVSYAVTRAG